ncbi:unnamed protein product, partial [marine sediment metagenome]
DKELIDSTFEELGDRVIKLEPIKIWQKSFKQRLEAATIKGAVKGLFK